MSTKQACISRIITVMLTVGLFCLLAAYPLRAESADQNQALIEAAKQGDLKQVQELL